MEIKILNIDEVNEKDTIYIDLRLLDKKINYIHYRIIEDFLLESNYNLAYYDPDDEEWQFVIAFDDEFLVTSCEEEFDRLHRFQKIIYLDEFYHYLKIIGFKPSDFKRSIALLKMSQVEELIEKLQTAFNGFLLSSSDFIDEKHGIVTLLIDKNNYVNNLNSNGLDLACNDTFYHIPETDNLYSDVRSQIISLLKRITLIK